MEPFRGHDPLSCSGDLPNQMGQRDGIEQHQRASLPPASRPVSFHRRSRGNDRGQQPQQQLSVVAAPLPSSAAPGGGAGMGESWIERTRADLCADLLERLPRFVVEECRKFDGLGGHVKVPHGEYYSLLIVCPGLHRPSSLGGRGGGGSGGGLMINARRSERRGGFVPPSFS
jgi:hypothetical protein